MKSKPSRNANVRSPSSYLFLIKNAVLGLGLGFRLGSFRVRVSVNPNPNPNPNPKTAFFKIRYTPTLRFTDTHRI